MTSPIGRDDRPYGIPGPRVGSWICRTAVSAPFPVVTVMPSIPGRGGDTDHARRTRLRSHPGLSDRQHRDLSGR